MPKLNHSTARIMTRVVGRNPPPAAAAAPYVTCIALPLARQIGWKGQGMSGAGQDSPLTGGIGPHRRPVPRRR